MFKSRRGCHVRVARLDERPATDREDGGSSPSADAVVDPEVDEGHGCGPCEAGSSPVDHSNHPWRTGVRTRLITGRSKFNSSRVDHGPSRLAGAGSRLISGRAFVRGIRFPLGLPHGPVTQWPECRLDRAVVVGSIPTRFTTPRARSSTGRAPAWHAGGSGFDSRRVHHRARTARCGRDATRRPSAAHAKGGASPAVWLVACDR